MFRSALIAMLFCLTPVYTSAQEIEQEEQIVLPVPDALGTISASFFDETYLVEHDAQHLGVDIPTTDGASVVSPVNGTVILNRIDVTDPFNAYLVIRSDATGFEHVLGHIKSDLQVPATVKAGDTVGNVVKAGSGPHLHYGINQLSVAGALDSVAGWGFGRAPANATPLDAGMRGWLAPNEVVIEKLLKKEDPVVKEIFWWQPGLVLVGDGDQNNGSSWTIKVEVEDQRYAKIAYDSIPCSGRLTLISMTEAKVSTSEEITENASRCINGGLVEIEQVGADNFSYFWKKGNSTASGSLRPMSAEVVDPVSELSEHISEDLEQSVGTLISPNPCDSVNWDAIVTNVSDMLSCDEARTINEFYAGKTMQFTVERVQFQNDHLYAIMRQGDSYSKYMLSPDVVNTITFSEAIAIKTRQRVVQSQCMFKMPMKRSLNQGDTVTVSAKLAKYERTSMGEFMLMACSEE